jgi:hypothetical protein
MITDLVVDALRWGKQESEQRDAKQKPNGKIVARIGSSHRNSNKSIVEYRASNLHASRQYYGPAELGSSSSESSISNANTPYASLLSRYELSPPSTRYEDSLYAPKPSEETTHGATGMSSNPPSTVASRFEGGLNIYPYGLYYGREIHENEHNTQACSESTPAKSSYSTSEPNTSAPEVSSTVSPVTPNIRRREQDKARRDQARLLGRGRRH